MIRESSIQQFDLTTRAAPLSPSSINEDERSIEAVLATQNRVRVFDFRRFSEIDEILIIDGARFADQITLLESHLRHLTKFVLGSVRSIRTEGTNLVARLFFVKGDTEVDVVWNKVRQGHLRDISIGYRVNGGDFTDIEPGTTATVGGRSYTAGEVPLRISRLWTVREGSVTPIGADEFAQMRQAAGQQRAAKELTTMNEKQRKYLESIGLRADTDDAGALAFLERLGGEQRERADELKGGTTDPAPATRTEPEPSVTVATVNMPAPVDVGKAVEEGQRAERKRVKDLRELAGDDVSEELLTRAIDEGWDTGRASPAFVRDLRDNRGAALGAGPGIICRDHNRDCTERAVSDALMMRCGLNLIDPTATDEVRTAQAKRSEQADPWRGYALVEMCREGLRIRGINPPHGREEMIRAAISTGSMTNIFTNVVGAKLLAAYLETTDTTGPFTTESDLADFKTVERTHLGKTGVLDPLPRGDTAKHATRSDAKEEYKIARYAKKFTVDEQDIIDDRFDALVKMPAELGAAAANLRPDLVFSILLANALLGADSIALFDDATHNNLITSSAFSEANLKIALIAMATQQQDDKNLGLFGKNILVPHALKFDVKQAIRSQELIVTKLITAASTGATAGGFNTLSDEGLGVIADSRLDNGVTDPASGTTYSGSATTWFVVASGGRHTIEVGYLAGTGRRPQIRSYVLSEGQWGVGWDIKHDLGAKALDYRGLHKATS